MKKKSLVILAFRNIIYKKSTTIQIVLSTLIAFVVLNSLFVYKKMMLNSIAEMSLRLASSYNIIYYIDENKVKEFEEHIDDMKEISGIKKYSFLSNDYQYRECEIEIDGVLYKCINNGRNISRTDRFDIQKFDSKYSLICKNEIKEANYRKKQVLYDGKYINKDNAIYLPEELAKMYGIDYKKESLVGKKVQISVKGHLIGDYIIGGILTEDFFEIKSRQNNIYIILMGKEDKEDKVYELYFDNFEDMSQIKEVLDNKISLKGELSKQYVQIEYLHNQILLLNKVYMVIGITLFVAVMFNSVRVVMYSFYRKSRFLGIIRANGYSKSQIFTIALIENVICISIGLFLALIISYCFMSYITVYISEMHKTSMELDVDTFIRGSIMSVIVSLFVLVITMIGMYITTIKKRVIELLF